MPRHSAPAAPRPISVPPRLHDLLDALQRSRALPPGRRRARVPGPSGQTAMPRQHSGASGSSTPPPASAGRRRPRVPARRRVAVRTRSSTRVAVAASPTPRRSQWSRAVAQCLHALGRWLAVASARARASQTPAGQSAAAGRDAAAWPRRVAPRAPAGRRAARRRPVVGILGQHAADQIADRRAAAPRRPGPRTAPIELAADHRRVVEPASGTRPSASTSRSRRARRRHRRCCPRPGRRAGTWRIGRLKDRRLKAGGRRGPGTAQRTGSPGLARNRLAGRMPRWVTWRACNRSSAWATGRSTPRSKSCSCHAWPAVRVDRHRGAERRVGDHKHSATPPGPMAAPCASGVRMPSIGMAARVFTAWARNGASRRTAAPYGRSGRISRRWPRSRQPRAPSGHRAGGIDGVLAGDQASAGSRRGHPAFVGAKATDARRQ